MFNLAMFFIVLGAAFLVQELIDRQAVEHKWLEKLCIVFSIIVGIFCLETIREDSLFRFGNDPLFWLGGYVGLLYFGVLRHWVFIQRVKKRRN